MSTASYKKFEDSESGAFPDKMTIFQDCLNAFNDSNINAKRCRLLLSRLVRLLATGETFPRTEATSLFFSISKLFQHKNESLRQMVYLAIKELTGLSDDILMVTSSIMKDIQGNEFDLIKPNALRTLIRVLDASTVHASERLIKSSIVSKNPSVSSAALVSAYHLLPISRDVVKRWATETQEAVSDLKNFPQTGEFYPNSSYISQYHALGLLYELKNHDKIALMKMIQQYSGLRNPLAVVSLVRIVGDLLRQDEDLLPQLWPLISQWLNNKSDAVQLEAVKLATTLPISAEQFASCVQVLQQMLSVPRVATRFAAVRILNRISLSNPERIVLLNHDLEGLINDSNRTISTYAITTLLKTGTDKNISSLIKTITKFINEVSDDFKTIIIDAVRTLAIKFPDQWMVILKFLGDILREGDGGFKFKNAIIEAYFDLAKFVPESKELVLEDLCDFIEDCEFTEILVRVLHLLGVEGPHTSTPSLYVRHIYNRVVLENSIVRSAAVTALSKFAVVPELAQPITALLSKCVQDNDDEVRDRSAIALSLIGGGDKAVKLLEPQHEFDLAGLEHKLSLYISETDFSKPFDVDAVSKYSPDELKAMELQRKSEAFKVEPMVAAKKEEPAAVNQYIEELATVEQFADYGAIVKSSGVVQLTEREAEFVVTVVKHFYSQHVVFQFGIENTLEDVYLEDVSVVCQPSEGFAEEFILPLDALKPLSKGTVYVSFGSENATGEFATTLSFTTKEMDPESGEPYEEGFQDEYEIDPVVIRTGDYLTPSFIGDFTHAFDELPYEQISVYNVAENLTLQNMVDRLCENTSCLPVEQTKYVTPDVNNHIVKLFGKSNDGGRVAMLIKIIKSSKGIALKAQIKSDNEQLVEELVNDLV